MDDTPLYLTYAQEMRHGLVPYRDFSVEYPPGALAAVHRSFAFLERFAHVAGVREPLRAHDGGLRASCLAGPRVP